MRRVSRFKAQGFHAFKIGWGPFGRRGDAGLDEAIVAAARDAAGAAAHAQWSMPAAATPIGRMASNGRANRGDAGPS